MLWGSIVCQTKEESTENEFKAIKTDCPTQSVFFGIIPIFNATI
jgi:hypothetical protein